MTRPTVADIAALHAWSEQRPWVMSYRLVAARLRRWMWWIVAFALVGAALGAQTKLYFPSTYTATSQVLFDPRGLKIFSNELTSGYFDANSAVNFVESQMGVLQSERVLTQVIKKECAIAAAGGSSGICPGSGAIKDTDKALESLRRSISVRRAERSFLVDITAKSLSPQQAAALSGAVVAAYLAEDAETRASVANRLTGELGGRLTALRDALRESEEKADIYRNDQNLVRVADKLLVEQRLHAATIALNESQGRLDRIRARAKQVETTPRTASALGALGAEADTRPLLVLVERRNAVLVELAPVALRAGRFHPALIELRSRLGEVDRSITGELGAIQTAINADLSRAEIEQERLASTVAELSVKVMRARKSEAELRTLEQETEANRKLLESFESRAREAREFGRIDAANLRVVSVARPPEARRLLPRLIIWAIAGAVLAIMLSTGGIIAWTLGSLGFAALPRNTGPSSFAAKSPAYTMRLRAEAFARYRYG